MLVHHLIKGDCMVEAQDEGTIRRLLRFIDNLTTDEVGESLH